MRGGGREGGKEGEKGRGWGSGREMAPLNADSWIRPCEVDHGTDNGQTDKLRQPSLYGPCGPAVMFQLTV